MKRIFGYLTFVLIGILFGITATKAELISWYRIQEMFRFESFHMYGIIGTAVVLGTIIIQLFKKFNVRTLDGGELSLAPKARSIPRYLFGGIIFGMGWAMTGACPGPMYTLFGNGFTGNGLTVFLPAIISAFLGTLVYGAIRHRLPH